MSDVLQAAEILTLAEEALDRLSPDEVDEGQKLLPAIVEAWAQLVDDAGVERVEGLARARDVLLARLADHSGAERIALLRIERVEGQIELAGVRLRALSQRPSSQRRSGAQDEIGRLTALGLQLAGEPESLTAEAQTRLSRVLMQAYGAGHE